MKKYGILIAVVLVLAGVFCLYQFTDIFGARQSQSVEAQAVPAVAAEALAESAPAEKTEETSETPADENPVLATVDGEEIRLDQVKRTLNTLLSGGYITDENDYHTALDYLIQTHLLSAKIKELGFDQYTAEEEEAFTADAAKEWEEAIGQYISYFGGQDADADAIRQEAIDFYSSQNVTEESILRQLKNESAQQKLEAYLMEGKDITPTEEEIRAIFEQTAQQDQASFDGDVGIYEMYQMYYGQELWFVPEGYRGIIHILLDADEALMTAYQDAQAAFEESVTDEKPEGDEALKTALETAKQTVIASKQDVINEIYSRLGKGESFVDLIKEYNQDPGMNDEDNLKNGYNVHKDSQIWDPAFTAAAFSDKMIKPGDVSDPIVGSNGIHILYYLRDVPGGIVELTDDIRTEISAYLENVKMNEVFSNALVSWQAEHEIVYRQDAIDALTVTVENEAE